MGIGVFLYTDQVGHTDRQRVLPRGGGGAAGFAGGAGRQGGLRAGGGGSLKQ